MEHRYNGLFSSFLLTVFISTTCARSTRGAVKVALHRNPTALVQTVDQTENVEVVDGYEMYPGYSNIGGGVYGSWVQIPCNSGCLETQIASLEPGNGYYYDSNFGFKRILASDVEAVRVSWGVDWRNPTSTTQATYLPAPPSCSDSIENGDESGVDCGGSCSACVVTAATTAEEEYQSQVKGDPHFLGFDGSRFDFQGSPGSVFNLITDEEFQLNARFMESPTDGKTYLGVIGLKSGSDQILITPDVVILNNEKVQEGAHSSLHGKDREEGLLIITAGRVRIKTGSFQVNIQVAQADGFAYLNIESASAVSDNLVHPHGILGQTAQYMVEGTEPQPVHLSHKNLDARGFLDGVASDYVVTDGLMGDGFTFNRFGVKKQQISPAVRRRFSFARASYEEKGRN